MEMLELRQLTGSGIGSSNTHSHMPRPVRVEQAHPEASPAFDVRHGFVPGLAAGHARLSRDSTKYMRDVPFEGIGVLSYSSFSLRPRLMFHPFL